jgi:ubiquinone/menaquinone biosynthesis C-methylase UbiE
MVDLVRRHFGRRVLDVGGGTGNHLDLCLEFVDRLIVLDLCAESVEELRRKTTNSDRLRLEVGDICDEVWVGCALDESVDTITCFDVLEHIEDEARALQQMRRILEPTNGVLILKVPAHRALYGSLDRLAGHYRRYDKKELCDRLRMLGFRIVDAFYANLIGAISWLFTGKILRPNDLSSSSVNFQIRVFDRYFVPWERRLESWIRPPMGQSLLVMARPMSSDESPD